MLPRIECTVGKPVTLRGYAIDVGHAISAIQLSLDGGEHWTEYPTDGTNDYQRVNWSFEYVPQREGFFTMLIRSINDAGAASPECDSVELIVRAAEK